MDALQVALVLTVKQINEILNMVSERPLKDVIDLFTTIRVQADKAVADAVKRIQDAKAQEQVDGASEQPPVPDAPATGGNGTAAGTGH